MKEFENKSFVIPVINEKKEKVDKQETLETILATCINIHNQNNKPGIGIESLRFIRRLSESFENSKSTNKIVLEDDDYITLKAIVEKNILAFWGTNKDITQCIEDFLNA